MFPRTLTIITVALGLALTAVPAVPAADEVNSSELALKVSDAQTANLERLKTYRWRVNTDLQSAGASKVKVTNEVAFDTKGNLKLTPVTGEMGEEDKPGLRGRRQDKKMSEMADYVGKVLNQSFAYMYMSKGTMVDMFEVAAITTENGITKIVGKDVYMKGDEVAMTLDGTTLLANHLTFKTKMGADVITGDVAYAPLKDGTNRVTKSVIDVAAKQLKIVSESGEFVKPEN